MLEFQEQMGGCRKNSFPIAFVVNHMQAGMIILWHGAVVDIPAGFVLCDGSNGTPDLRDKFVYSAGPTRPTGQSGGNWLHVHGFDGNGHTHGIGAGNFIDIGTNWHNVTESGVATGVTDSAQVLPPYHSLSYIMKT